MRLVLRNDFDGEAGFGGVLNRNSAPSLNENREAVCPKSEFCFHLLMKTVGRS
jgi:hypothetical protein